LALYVPFKHFAGGPTATDGEPNVPVDGQTRPGRAKSTRRGGVSPALLDAERRAESSDALARDIESYELALYGHRQRWFDSLARRHGAPGGVVR
ncbi:MAG: hypothetical protein KC417_15190, partial [Myxococcales bacterium]|nr:hypothetical protein [Myxococcales bacterium]